MKNLLFLLVVILFGFAAESCSKEEVRPLISDENVFDMVWIIKNGEKDCGVALHTAWEFVENGSLDITNVECENEINRAKQWSNTKEFATAVAAARWIAKQTEELGGCSESRQEKLEGGGWRVFVRGC